MTVGFCSFLWKNQPIKFISLYLKFNFSFILHINISVIYQDDKKDSHRSIKSSRDFIRYMCRQLIFITGGNAIVWEHLLVRPALLEKRRAVKGTRRDRRYTAESPVAIGTRPTRAYSLHLSLSSVSSPGSNSLFHRLPFNTRASTKRMWPTHAIIPGLTPSWDFKTSVVVIIGSPMLRRFNQIFLYNLKCKKFCIAYMYLLKLNFSKNMYLVVISLLHQIYQMI